MNILCIGEALVDMVCTDTGVKLSQGEHYLAKPGGAPANVAAAIAAQGGSVGLVAKLGNDPFGQKLVSVLEALGVNTQYLLRDNSHFTTLAFVSLLENGDRDFLFNRGADGLLSVKDIEQVDLSTVSIIHFGSATAFLPGPLQEAYTALLQKAIQHNIFTSFDPNYRQLLYHDKQGSFIAQCQPFLQHCDFCKLSDEEAMLLTSTRQVSDAVQQLSSIIKGIFTITIGKEGSLLCMQGNTWHIPSIEITPTDTTGAGDAFVGTLLYQLGKRSRAEIKTLSVSQWKDIIVQANGIAAETCKHYGAMEVWKHMDIE